MADQGGKIDERSNSPSQNRRERRSEGYLFKFGSKSASDAIKKRRYSANDADNVEERLKLAGQSRRKYSLAEMLLGQRSLYSANESVLTQTVKEVPDGKENLSEESSELSNESSSQGQNEALSQTDRTGPSKSKETTQPEKLNSHLLDTVLSRLSNITGIGNPGNVNKGGIGQDNSGEYTTVYSDDFLMDRIYRQMSSKKKEK